MKKEQKRYLLVEYYTARDKEYNSIDEVNHVLDEIRKYNKRKKTHFIVGNITLEEKKDGKVILHSHIYNKLENWMTISELDNMTSVLDEHELILKYRDKLKRIYELAGTPAYYPDINIAYFEEPNPDENEEQILKGIKYIPVLYKDSVQYMDQDYVFRCISEHSNSKDFEFFEKMYETFTTSHNADNELDNLKRSIDRVKFQGYNTYDLYYAGCALYKGLVVEREKDGSITRDEKGKYQISRRRTRDFGFFIKNYGSSKTKTPMGYSYSVGKKRIEALKKIREEIDEIRQKEIEERKELELQRKQRRNRRR